VEEIVTSGTICLDDEYGFVYNVAKIEYKEREDETFSYIFTPNYSVIELLPSTIFQGIPGLDLDKRKSVYVRDNIVPVFISERTPAENREDLWELLDACGMEYLNRLEWLIRTYTRYSGDGLYVCRQQKCNLNIESLNELGNRSSVICRRVLETICMGGEVITDEFVIDDNNRKMMFQTYMSLYRTERKYLDERRREGIKKSSAEGNYKGRSRIKLDTLKMQEMFYHYENGKITSEQAAEVLGISKSTFIRRYREYKK